jgi:lysophospholipase L1-like esterase
MPPSKPILFVGSSIIALWDGLAHNFRGVLVLNTAVSGAQTSDILGRLDELVSVHGPRMVCYYCGSNDINAVVPVDTITGNTVETYVRLRRQLPTLTFVYLSIIRAPQKMNHWQLVDQVNSEMRRQSTIQPDFHFIDINPVFFSAEQTPRFDFYQEDQLHLTVPAYAALGEFLAPPVMKLLPGRFLGDGEAEGG